jgi:hypothetical protein
MPKAFQATAAIALALTLQLAPIASQAALVAGHGATPLFHPETEPTPAAFLDQTIDRRMWNEFVLNGRAVDHREQTIRVINPDRAFALSLGGLPSGLPSRGNDDLDLCLWNLLNIAHSQRDGKAFDRLDEGSRYVFETHGQQPLSAVPLPASVWLFLMGILGLVGARITGIRSQGVRTGREGSLATPGLHVATA